jgi:hypothetical protein
MKANTCRRTEGSAKSPKIAKQARDEEDEEGRKLEEPRTADRKEAAAGQRQRRDEQHPGRIAQPVDEPRRHDAGIGLHAGWRTAPPCPRVALTSALAPAPSTIRVSGVAQPREGAVERGPSEHRAARERGKCGAGRLTGGGDVWHRAVKRHEKGGSGECGPDAIAAGDDGGERHTIGGPDRAEIAASDFGGCLPELARHVVGREHHHGLDEKPSHARGIGSGIGHFSC